MADLQTIADDLAAEIHATTARIEADEDRRLHLQRALDEMALLGIEPSGAAVDPPEQVIPPRITKARAARPITVAGLGAADRAREAAKVRVACETCGREFSQMGIEMHRRSHGGGIVPKPKADDKPVTFSVDDARAALESA